MSTRNPLEILSLLALSAAVAGCGSGMEPMSALNQQGPLPSLALPIAEAAITGINAFSQSGAVTASDGLDIFAPISQNVISPAPGVVSFIDQTVGAGIVYVVHSLHLTTRLSGLQSVAVLPGALVQAGSGLGTSSAVGAALHFTTYYDNTLVCPLSYMSYAAQKRAAIVSGTLALCR